MSKKKEQEKEYRFDFVIMRLKEPETNDVAELKAYIHTLVAAINDANIQLIKHSKAYKDLKDILDD